MKTLVSIILLALTSALSRAADIGVDWYWVDMTNEQAVDCERSSRLLESVLGNRNVSNRISISVRIQPLPANILGITSATTYTYDHGVFYSYGGTIKLNSLYVHGFSRPKFSAIVLHEISHILAWNRTLWNWRGILYGDIFVTGDVYYGGASDVFAYVYPGKKFWVDSTGHLGLNFGYDQQGNFGYLGEEKRVDDLFVMDADYDEGMIVNDLFWAVYADQLWPVAWSLAATGPVESVLPVAHRRPRVPVIVTTAP